MKHSSPLLLVALLSLTSFQSSHAQPTSQVSAMVAPAWIEHADQRSVLKPGAQVENGDRLITANGGRVQLQMNNNAELQLGEKSEFQAHQLDTAKSPADRYQGRIEILKGAFRYISEVFGPGPDNADFRVDVGLASIGIRGTDFWGITDGSTDTIVLIEGVIEVTPDTGSSVTLTNPQSIIQSVHGVGAGSLAQVDMATLQKSAAMTALPRGQGVMTVGGQFQVVLASLKNRQSAENMRIALETQGYPAITEFVADIGYNRVVIPLFSSQADAAYFVQNSARDLDVDDAWVKRRTD